GLAVDYDGSKTNFHSSMDYTVEEYARDIVYAIYEACESAGVPHPHIVTESGRAIVAHHAVLVMQVIDDSPTSEVVSNLPEPPSDDRLMTSFKELYEGITVKNCHESLHDAVSLREEVVQRFING